MTRSILRIARVKTCRRKLSRTALLTIPKQVSTVVSYRFKKYSSVITHNFRWRARFCLPADKCQLLAGARVAKAFVTSLNMVSLNFFISEQVTPSNDMQAPVSCCFVLESFVRFSTCFNFVDHLHNIFFLN